MIELEKTKYFTKQETADKLGVTMNTIVKWIWQKKLTTYKVGNRAYIKESDIKAFIDSNKSDPRTIRRPAAFKKKEGGK